MNNYLSLQHLRKAVESLLIKINEKFNFVNDKVDTLDESLTDVAFSGDYNDLSNKPSIPTVPTNISAFNNDSGYLTYNETNQNYLAKTDLAPLNIFRAGQILGATTLKARLDGKSNQPIGLVYIAPPVNSTGYNYIVLANYIKYVNIGSSQIKTTNSNGYPKVYDKTGTETTNKWLYANKYYYFYAPVATSSSERYVVFQELPFLTNEDIDLTDYALKTDIPENELFIATYGTTTYAEVLAAYNANKIIVCKYTLGTGDLIVPFNYYVKPSAYVTAAFHFATVENSNSTRYLLSVNSSDNWSARNNIINALSNTNTTIEEGDRIVFTNTNSAYRLSSNSSLAFGTATNQYLANNGTWQNIPTNISTFINDAGYLTSYNETDPIFSASPAANITSTDITNWNNKLDNTTLADYIPKSATWNNTIDAIAHDLPGSQQGKVSYITSYGIYFQGNDGQNSYSYVGILRNGKNVLKLYGNSSYAANGIRLTNLATPIENSDAVNKLYVDTAIGNINGFEVAVVNSLPTENIDTHTFYFMSNSGSGNNIYDEYLYINNAWEKIGSTEIDLSGYLLSTDIADWAKASTKPSYTANEVGALSDSSPAAAITSIDITNWNAKAEISNIPTTTSDLTNDSNFVSDANYVHTDSNFTAAEKTKLAGIAEGATVDDHKWNDVSLNKGFSSSSNNFYVPFLSATTSTTAQLALVTNSPAANRIAKYDANRYLNSTTPAADDSSTKVATTTYVKTAVDNNKSNWNANNDEAGYILNRPFYSETVQNGTINIVSPFNYVTVDIDDYTYRYNFPLIDAPDNTFRKDYYEYLKSLYGKGYPGPISLSFTNSGVTYTSASGDVSGREGNYRSIYYLTGTDATITIDVFYDGNDSYESSAIIVSPEDLNILNLDYVDLTVTLPNYSETIHKLDNKYLNLDTTLSSTSTNPVQNSAIKAYIDNHTPVISYPVTSVNSKTGAVQLTAADVGALADTVDVTKWNGVALNNSDTLTGSSSFYVPILSTANSTTAQLLQVGMQPTNNGIAIYDTQQCLNSTTVAANNNSNKVATTAYVDRAVGAITAPVTSVNGQTGAVTITIPSAITNTYDNDPANSKVMLYSTTSSTSTVNSTRTSGALAFTSNGTLQIGKAHSEEGSKGSIDLSNSASSNQGYTTITPSATAAVTLTLPNTTGTLALTSDIPSVPSWALQSTKPTYTASEVGAVPSEVDTGHGSQYGQIYNNATTGISFVHGNAAGSSQIKLLGRELTLASTKSQGNSSIVLKTNNTNVITLSEGQATIIGVVTPTTNDMAANKGYVDSAISALTIPTRYNSSTNTTGYLTMADLPIYDGTVI